MKIIDVVLSEIGGEVDCCEIIIDEIESAIRKMSVGKFLYIRNVNAEQDWNQKDKFI